MLETKSKTPQRDIRTSSVLAGFALALTLSTTARAHAQPDAGVPDPEPDAGNPAASADAGPPPSPQSIVRPKLLLDEKPRYPPKAFEDQREADVTVLITLDEKGGVIDVEIAAGAGYGFDEEALRAARKLRFSPATVDAVPTAVQIRYTFRFRIDEKETVAKPPPTECADCAVDERKPGTISVTVFERGKGKRLPGVEVYLLDEDRVVLTDAKGVFSVTGPPGAYAFTIRPPGFYPYNATERIEPGETLKLKYFVRRNRRDRFSTIVWGSEGRAEVARTSLVDDEIRSVAGTMGDPIRVATLLPGSTSSASGLGYPIIRGSLPGESLYEIDGIYIPMLYHLLFGPAVIHPRFVDQITFNPGGYSAEYGRFPGGHVGATTARVDDDPLWVADLSIVETSLLRSQKIGDNSELVAAVRYGTLGYIVEGLATDIVFRYWDYQARAAHRFSNGGKLTLTVLGASDAAGEKDPETGEEDVLRIGFHTADLRYLRAFGNMWIKGGVQLSTEFFRAPDDDVDGEPANSSGDADTHGARPYFEVGWAKGDLEIKGGGDALLQRFGLDLTDEGSPFEDAESGTTTGVWASAEYKLGKLLLNPSVRFDSYRYTAPNRTDSARALNPRVSAAYQLTPNVALKASVGRFSGPPRFSFVDPPVVFGPIPGFQGAGLNLGLVRTDQYQTGVEVKLPGDLDLAVTGYYHDSFAPVDFSLIDVVVEADPTACDGSQGTELTPLNIKGRSYGAEMLLRRKLGKKVFGWASYGISRAERTFTSSGEEKSVPFEFDQTHVFNGVVSWEVGRDWTLGGVLHFNTGRPRPAILVDNCQGFFDQRRGEYNSERFPSYWRIDFRVQKREVFETWFFDFYIDFFNAAFQFETIDVSVNPRTGELEEENLPLFIPMIGIRGEF